MAEPIIEFSVSFERPAFKPMVYILVGLGYQRLGWDPESYLSSGRKFLKHLPL